MKHPVAAAVAVENTLLSFDKLYDYLIPDALAPQISLGCRVLVAFGSSKKLRQAIVFKLYGSGDCPKGKLKYIKSVEDSQSYLSEEMLKLALRLSERVFCPIFETARAFMPSGAYLKVRKSYRIIADARASCGEEQLGTEQREILRILSEADDFVGEEKLLAELGDKCSDMLLSELIDKGFIICNTDTRRRINDSTVRSVALKSEYYEGECPSSLTKKQKEVVELLRKVGSATTKEIAYYTGVTQTVTENLHKRGIVEYSLAEVYRSPVKSGEKRDTSPIELSKEQERVFLRLKALAAEEGARAALLHGVTGSGKTKIYMKLIDEMLLEGKGVIVLVPEISLTPQMLELFSSRYADAVAVVHSRLSVGERFDEFKRIRRGEAKVVVGTRSAVFSPVENLAMIVVDEEQESSYKSEMSPRYHAVDVAKFRCGENGALLLLASATPSVESYAAAKAGRFELLELNERYGSRPLPEVITVDMSVKENVPAARTISFALAGELEKNLKSGDQSILLINRRGFNSFIICTKCKKVVSCPNCSISLTYHAANDRLMCHYCGYSERASAVCPECSSETVRFSGFGTQRVEAEVRELFPKARLLRMDADTVSAKNSHSEFFEAFARGDYDIMIGTQMVAKGLDFPDVTLVGVVSVDQQLYNDDYKSSERVFDLLTQVVGRCGRGKKPGRAVIQTLSPENAVIELAAAQDYRSFYETEALIRRAMVYPPFCRICTVNFSGSSDYAVKNAAQAFFRLFTETHSQRYSQEKLMLLGPAAPKLAKVSNMYRERIIIKCKATQSFRDLLRECLKTFSTFGQYNKIKVYADMDPESIF